MDEARDALAAPKAPVVDALAESTSQGSLGSRKLAPKPPVEDAGGSCGKPFGLQLWGDFPKLRVGGTHEKSKNWGGRGGAPDKFRGDFADRRGWGHRRICKIGAGRDRQGQAGTSFVKESRT